MVCKVLVKFLIAKDIYPDEVCILTAYHAQKSRLKQEISHFKNVRLPHQKYPSLVDSVAANTLINDVIAVEDSVDVEKELTIFSAARASSKLVVSAEQNELDILSDCRTINTVLTRSRRGLVVVGDLQTLIKDEHWREWLTWATANGIIVNF